MRFAKAASVCMQHCILLALLLLPYAAGALSFTSPYNGMTVRRSAGSSVNFTWDFSANVGIVKWGLKKSGVSDFITNGVLVTISSAGVVTLSGPPAYTGRVSGSRSSGQAIFTLTSITRTDEQLYGCQINPLSGFDQSKFDFVQLKVEEKPTITRPVNANASYDEESPVDIICEATGTPDPNVEWIHKGQVKSTGSKKASLTFGKITRDNAGEYICRATNPVGKAEKQLNLVVNCKYIESQ